MAETPEDIDRLRARVEQLETENQSLRVEATSGGAGNLEPISPRQLRRRGRAATTLAIILIVLGCLLAPVAVITGWAKVTLTDTDRFVATYAPLAKDPQIQGYIVDQTMDVINNNVNIDQVVSDVIDGVKSLGAGDRADAALDALKGPAAHGLESSIRNAVSAFVRSDAFDRAWVSALRVSQTQLTATMRNDPNAILAARNDGTIGVQLGPIVAQIKSTLIAQGISIASRIPTVNKTIPIAQSSSIQTYQLGYRTVIAAGSWLPWISLLFLVGGVLIARRSRVLIGAGLGFSAAMVVLLLGLLVGRTVLITSLPPAVVPSAVISLIYDTATNTMKGTAAAGLVLGLLIAGVAWFTGPFPAARSLRGLYSAGIGDLRAWAGKHQISTGRVGEGLYAQRFVTRVIVGVGFAAAIVFIRPITVALIVCAALIALGVLFVLNLVERPPQKIAPGSATDTEPTQPLPQQL